MTVGTHVRLLAFGNRREVAGIVKGFLKTRAPQRVFVVVARVPELLYPDDLIVEQPNCLAAAPAAGWNVRDLLKQELEAFGVKPVLHEGNGAGGIGAALEPAVRRGELGRFFAKEVVAGPQNFYPALKLSQVREQCAR
jgi:hypothetical protein